MWTPEIFLNSVILILDYKTAKVLADANVLKLG